MKELHAFAPIRNKEVSEFHNKRVLFSIIEGVLYYEDESSGLSHYKWFEQLNLCLDTDKIIDSCLRGYYFEGSLVAYKGKYFDYDDNLVTILLDNLSSISRRMNLDLDTNIYVGCIISDLPIFLPEKYLGRLSDLM